MSVDATELSRALTAADVALAGGAENMTRMPFYDMDARSGATLGHRRQLAETMGVDPDDLNAVYAKVEPWLAEVGSVQSLSVDDVTGMLERVLESELSELQ